MSYTTTLYLDMCYTSLARYANAIQQDPGQLACVTIAISLSKVHRLTSYIFDLMRDVNYSGDLRSASMLHDCFTNLDYAIDEICNSLKQMQQLGASSAGASLFLFQGQWWKFLVAMGVS